MIEEEELEAIDKCFEDITILNRFFDEEYITLEEFFKIKHKIVDRIVDVRTYYINNPN